MLSSLRCIVVGVVALGATVGVARAQPGASLANDAETEAPVGHVTLSWSADGAPEEEVVSFQLERSDSEAFDGAEVWYEGPATQSFVSGLADGRHYFRVRARVGPEGAWGGWSPGVCVRVEHQSLALAWSLFAVGAVLFACIVGFVAWHSVRGPGGGGGSDE